MKFTLPSVRTKLAFLIAFVSAPAAQSAVLVIDNFGLNQDGAFAFVGPTSTTLNSGTGFWSSRTLSILRSEDSGASIKVINGALSINTGPGFASTSAVTWQLDLSALSTALTQATFFSITLDQAYLDVGTVEISPGGAVRTTSHSGTTVEILSSNSVSGIINPFTITFNSSDSTDSKWQNLAIRYTCRAGAQDITNADQTDDRCQVPLPGTAPLLALGVLGLTSFALRRKQ